MHTDRPILIAYDGSSDARFALAEAASTLPGRDAVVLFAREPLESVAAHLEGRPALERNDGIERAEGDAAERIAEEGARLAGDAGLVASPMVVSSPEPAADAIVRVADELDVGLVVIGSRGRRGMRALLLGSTSHHVLHHVRRPTLIVPSPPLVAARREAISAERADRVEDSPAPAA